MERCLLDTNIVIFLLLGRLDNISDDVKEFIFSYGNQINTSSVVGIEISQLYRIGKIQSKKYKTAFDMIKAIEKDLFMKILPFAKPHVNALSKLKIIEGHKDPFDHSIIAHAITEKLMLVSSDRKFESYSPQKLNFFHNQR